MWCVFLFPDQIPQTFGKRRKRKIKDFLLTWWTEKVCIMCNYLVGLSLSWNFLRVKWSIIWMLAANTDKDIKAMAWVLFVCILVNTSYCWSPAAQPEQLLQQLKFLMAITQHHSAAQPADGWGTFSLCCTDSGVAACISEKAKALSWPGCRGAWHDINENTAVMSSSHQPCVDPAWQTDTTASCWATQHHQGQVPPCPHPVPTILPSHPDLLAVYRHASPLCLPEEHWVIWDL